MKRIILGFAAWIALALPCYAGSVSFQVAQTGQTTLTKTYTVPDADVARIVSAYQSGANTAVNGTATRAQVLQYWVQTFVNSTVQAVTASESAAAVQALPAVTPINPQ